MRGNSSLLLVAVVLVCGCNRKGGAHQDHHHAAGSGKVTEPVRDGEGDAGKDLRSTTTNDPWARIPPIEFIAADNGTVLPRDQFSQVTHNEADALAKLDASPQVKVTPQEAKAFTGRSFDEPGGELVLLRALALNEGTGAFSVTWLAGKVRVNHGCLGRHPVPQIRRAIVARLPALPTEVYVDCEMAE